MSVDEGQAGRGACSQCEDGVAWRGRVGGWMDELGYEGGREGVIAVGGGAEVMGWS